MHKRCEKVRKKTFARKLRKFCAKKYGHFVEPLNSTNLEWGGGEFNINPSNVEENNTKTGETIEYNRWEKKTL